MNPKPTQPRLFLIAYLATFCLSLETSALAQGTVLFQTRYPLTGPSPSVNAPVFNVGGEELVAGDRFLAQLYWRSNDSSPWQPVGPQAPFLTGPLAGYVSAGPVAIDGAPPGSSVQIYMRAWDTAFPANSPAARGGQSVVIYTLPLGGSDGSAPIPLFGLVGFEFNAIIPEPSPTVLAGYAGVACFCFFWLRRKVGTARRCNPNADGRS